MQIRGNNAGSKGEKKRNKNRKCCRKWQIAKQLLMRIETREWITKGVMDWVTPDTLDCFIEQRNLFYVVKLPAITSS